jgi:predicted TIM-barrel fold metal-dependent hydrolase
MPTRRLPFAVFDADNHMYETPEALTKFLPAQHRGKVGFVQVDGRPKLVVKNTISHMIPNPTFERVAAPGSAEAYFMGHNPEGKTFREFVGKAIKTPEAFQSPAPRLALLDEQGVDHALMYPTLASLIEERTKDDVELTHVLMHALNEWLHEHWTFDYEGRIFATPVIALPIVEKAIEELHWCLERGMKTFLLRPAPVPSPNGGSRSMGLPEFDPFWQAVQDAGVPVTLHAADSGYHTFLNVWEPSDEFLSFNASPLRDIVMGHRAIEDTVAALIIHGVPSRFPDIRFLLVENGSSWVPGLLKQLERSWNINARLFAEHPVEVFKRAFWVHPFREDDVNPLIDLLGAENILFGSDFPHPEGMADPLSFVDMLDRRTPEEVERIMGGNLAEVLGIRMRQPSTSSV